MDNNKFKGLCCKSHSHMSSSGGVSQEGLGVTTGHSCYRERSVLPWRHHSADFLWKVWVLMQILFAKNYWIEGEFLPCFIFNSLICPIHNNLTTFSKLTHKFGCNHLLHSSTQRICLNKFLFRKDYQHVWIQESILCTVRNPQAHIRWQDQISLWIVLNFMVEFVSLAICDRQLQNWNTTITILDLRWFL